MHYLIISFSHKNTDLSMREKIVFQNNEVLKEYYESFNNHPDINETIILSTCNRTEIFVSISKFGEPRRWILSELSRLSGIDVDTLEEMANIYEDQEAIFHHFSVVSSLDSIVVGETQIAGQVKEAFKFSYDNGYSSQKLVRAMHFAFRCSAQVRNATDISKSPISISSVAVSKAKELFQNIGGFSAVVIGAGEMSRLAAQHLITAGVNVIIINRDMDKARLLCEELGHMSEYKPFSELKDYLNRYRLLFSATSAQHAVITKDMIEEREFERHWFDIAVPRDIENDVPVNVIIHSVDDLEDIVNQNKTHREIQARKGLEIVSAITDEFFVWLQSLSYEPLIKELRDMAKESSHKELKRALKKGYIPVELSDQVEKILHQAFNGFLHTPTVKLKDVAKLPESDTIIESLKYIFDLKSKAITVNMYKSEYHLDKKLIDINEEK